MTHRDCNRSYEHKGVVDMVVQDVRYCYNNPELEEDFAVPRGKKLYHIDHHSQRGAYRRIPTRHKNVYGTAERFQEELVSSTGDSLHQRSKKCMQSFQLHTLNSDHLVSSTGNGAGEVQGKTDTNHEDYDTSSSTRRIKVIGSILEKVTPSDSEYFSENTSRSDLQEWTDIRIRESFQELLTSDSSSEDKGSLVPHCDEKFKRQRSKTDEHGRDNIRLKQQNYPAIDISTSDISFRSLEETNPVHIPTGCTLLVYDERIKPNSTSRFESERKANPTEASTSSRRSYFYNKDEVSMYKSSDCTNCCPRKSAASASSAWQLKTEIKKIPEQNAVNSVFQDITDTPHTRCNKALIVPARFLFQDTSDYYRKAPFSVPQEGKVVIPRQSGSKSVERSVLPARRTRQSFWRINEELSFLIANYGDKPDVMAGVQNMHQIVQKLEEVIFPNSVISSGYVSSSSVRKTGNLRARIARFLDWPAYICIACVFLVVVGLLTYVINL